MDRNIKVEFNLRELRCIECLLTYESTYYGDGDIRFNLRDRIEKIRRAHDPTISRTSSRL